MRTGRTRAGSTRVLWAGLLLSLGTGGCLCSGSTNTAAPYTGEVIIRAEPKPEAEWLGCAADADCATFKDGCCGCNEGGRALAIAKKNVDDYDGLLAFECGASVCAMMISTDPSCKLAPRCNAGKCVLGEAGAPGTTPPASAVPGTTAAPGTAAAGPATTVAPGTAAAAP